MHVFFMSDLDNTDRPISIEIVPLPLTILLLSSFLHLLSILFQNCLPALLLDSSEKKPYVPLLCHLYPSSVIPSTVLFLFILSLALFLALVAQQHQVVFGGKEKKKKTD